MSAEVKKTRNSRSIMVTLTIAFFVLSLTVLLIAGGLQIYFNFQTQGNLIAEQQERVAHEAADSVGDFINDKIIIMNSGIKFGNLATAYREEKKLILEKILGLEPAFRQIILIYGQEMITVSRTSGLVKYEITEHEKNEIISQTSDGRVYVSPIRINEVTSEPEAIIAVQVTDVFGDFSGILMAEVNLKFLWDLVDNIKIGKNGLAYVVDSNGDLIAFGDISRVLRGENLIHLKEVSRFVSHVKSDTEYEAKISEGILGTQVIANHVHLDITDWAVVVELPVDEAYETAIQGIYLSIMTIALSAFFAILVGVYISKRITKPIKRLTRNIEDISMGRLETSIDPKLKESNDEIGALARAFDRTLVSLKLAMRERAPEAKKDDQK